MVDLNLSDATSGETVADTLAHKFPSIGLTGEAYRQQNSAPILKEVKAFLDINVSKVPKDSITGNAIYYMLNQ